MSQSELAAGVGISYSQLQKYESGANRISASKLFAISKVLGMSCGWLMGEDGAPPVDALESAFTAKDSKMFAVCRRLEPDHQDAVHELMPHLARSSDD